VPSCGDGKDSGLANHRNPVMTCHQQIAAEPTSPNLPYAVDFLFKGGVDYMTTSGAVDGPCALANFKLETTNVATGVPIMVWRSVGNSHTEFARESAIDELAIAAGRDPVDLRRDLLADNPRTLRALELACARCATLSESTTLYSAPTTPTCAATWLSPAVGT
jgi:isoquinoline 1-oxidoreductase subunit beta